MRFALRLYHLLALACLAVTLAGCSSGGVGGPVRTSSSSASGQVATAVFVQQWGQILWGLATSQTGTQPPSLGDPVLNPDGSIRLDITWPDGTTQTVLQSVQRFDGVSKTTTDYRVTSSDGLSVAYTSVVDDRGSTSNESDDTTHVQGHSTLPGNLTQDFTWVSAGGQTAVQARQSDGSTFALTVPLRPPELAFPDFSRSRPTSGTYTARGLNIRFTLTSTEDAGSRWTTMLADFGAGMTGKFSLNPDFSGSGQLIQDGRLLAVLSWTHTGETEVRFLTAERSATSAAGAALDFLAHRWQTLTALGGPSPGVGMPRSGLRSRGHRAGISRPK